MESRKKERRRETFASMKREREFLVQFLEVESPNSEIAKEERPTTHDYLLNRTQSPGARWLFETAILIASHSPI